MILFLNLIIIASVSLSVSVASDHSIPCWCAALNSSISKTRSMLAARYSEKSLDASSTFETSGRHNSLVKRLHASLQYKRPFRIGMYGGSFSVTNDHSSYLRNISRWLNSVLISSECDSNQIPLTDILKSSCSFEPIVQDNFGNCPVKNVSHYVHGPATFCSEFPADILDYVKYGHNFSTFRT